MIVKMALGGLLMTFILCIGLFVGFTAGKQIGSQEFCTNNLGGVFIYDSEKEQTDCINGSLWNQLDKTYNLDIGGLPQP